MPTQPVAQKKKKIVLPEAQIAERAYAWHAHDAREVIRVISSAEAGLASSEVESRLKEYGQNVFTPAPTQSIFKKVFAQLTAPLSLVL